VEINGLKMLSKKNRIKDKRLIKKILKKGRRVKFGYLLFKYLPSEEENSKFAFIVSKKVSKKAVVRNKIKRQLSEILRTNLANFPIKVNGVFIALPGIGELDFAQKKENLFQVLKAIKK